MLLQQLMDLHLHWAWESCQVCTLWILEFCLNTPIKLPFLLAGHLLPEACPGLHRSLLCSRHLTALKGVLLSSIPTHGNTWSSPTEECRLPEDIRKSHCLPATSASGSEATEGRMMPSYVSYPVIVAEYSIWAVLYFANHSPVSDNCCPLCFQCYK